jgi:hypothetical protein
MGEQAYTDANCHNNCNCHAIADAYEDEHLNSNTDSNEYADPE